MPSGLYLCLPTLRYYCDVLERGSFPAVRGEEYDTFRRLLNSPIQ